MSYLSNKLKNLKDYRSITDSKTKDEIVIEYAPLVKFIAKKIASRLPSNVELDDLISCGVIGLMDAIKKFDPGRDNKFKTYAEFRIRGAMYDELRAQDWVPRSVREKAKRLERAYAKLETALGRPATDAEMCKELDCSLEEFHILINKAQVVYFLNMDDSLNFSKGDKKLLANIIEDNYSNNPLASANSQNVRDKIKEGIKLLPEKQRLVLSLYYYEDLNLKEIGKILDVTESRISQLHTQALIGLKSRLKPTFEPEEQI